MDLTKEDKKLLLKDFCARLPYGLLVKTPDHYNPQVVEAISIQLEVIVQSNLCYSLLFEAKPYLRPLTSMTDEEAKDYIECKYSSGKVIELRRENGCNIGTDIKLMWLDVFDFLNAHHFDYRNLIEKGLAIEAPDGMY